MHFGGSSHHVWIYPFTYSHMYTELNKRETNVWKGLDHHLCLEIKGANNEQQCMSFIEKHESCYVRPNRKCPKYYLDS